MDYAADGMLERTTVYDPPRLRIDETPEHTTQGAEWIEASERIVFDPLGNELNRELVRDAWTVLDDDAECDTAFGVFPCLHVHRLRIEGGLSIKEYKFVRGLGKVAELGDQDEVLTECQLR
jgi:hypothetical protein